MLNCTKLRVSKLNDLNLKTFNSLSTNVKSKLKKLNPFSQTVLLPKTDLPIVQSESDYENDRF